MFQLISYSVIRQALNWANLPRPMSIQGKNRMNIGDFTTQDIIACFAGDDVRELYGYASLYDGSAAFTKFMYDLSESFCADIKPVQAHYEVTTNVLSVTLYCTITPETEQLPLIEWDGQS